MGFLMLPLFLSALGFSQTDKAKEFCVAFKECQKTNRAATTMCVRDALFKSKLTAKKLEVTKAKDFGAVLRREGFFEATVGEVTELPQGTILVLDAHDPIKEKKPLCPKVYGNVLLKCGDFWVDSNQNALDFYVKRDCRTKGIWIHPLFKSPTPPQQ